MNDVIDSGIKDLTFKSTHEADPLVVRVDGEDIFRLLRDGTIIYKGREVESDDELREAVTYFIDHLSGRKRVKYLDDIVANQ